MTKKLLITDFDGVLCDSVQECFLVAYNTYKRLYTPSFQRVLNLAEIEPAKREQFRKLRPYLKGAEDMVPIFLAVEECAPIKNQLEFDRWRDKHQAQLATYQQAFYAERDYLQRHAKAVWLSLNPLFDGIGEALRQQNSFKSVWILTTKRQQDVLEIFHYQGISFPADQVIYIQAAAKSKKLLEILRTNGVVPSESVYIEDQIDFLVEAQKHGIGSYLVAWGYVSAEQNTLAIKHGIPMIEIAEFQKVFRSFA
jgi:phosphoglycolate phosphatase-like HAD superfamily hydrolase